MFTVRMLMRVRVVFVGVLMRVLQRRVLLAVGVGVLVLRIIVVLVVMMHMPFLTVRVPAFVPVFMRRVLFAVLVRVAVSAFVAMRVSAVKIMAGLHMRRAAVDVELHALDVLPLGAVVVHVEVADVQLAQFPFERTGLHAEINERADHHVAADAGDAVEEEGFHAWETVRIRAVANSEL